MSSLHVRTKRVPLSESTAGFRFFTAGGEICEKQKTAGTEKPQVLEQVQKLVVNCYGSW
jgi:hypothetical protein